MPPLPWKTLSSLRRGGQKDRLRARNSVSARLVRWQKASSHHTSNRRKDADSRRARLCATSAWPRKRATPAATSAPTKATMRGCAKNNTRSRTARRKKTGWAKMDGQRVRGDAFRSLDAAERVGYRPNKFSRRAASGELHQKSPLSRAGGIWIRNQHWITRKNTTPKFWMCVSS